MPRQTYFVFELPCRKLNFSLKQGSYTNIHKKSQQLAKQLLKSEEDTAVAAGLAPQKEGCALLPGTDWRPADILIPRWEAGKDAALDVTVIHPLQDATRA